MIPRVAIAVAVVLVACASDDPAARSPRAREDDGVAAPRHARTPEIASDGSTIHGLPLPIGSERVAGNDLGDDYVVPHRSGEVADFVGAQLLDGTRTTRDGDVHEFRRVTPRGEDPAVVRLYVMVMPYGRGTLLRVQRLPATELTPEQLRENVERYEREHGRLD